MRQTLIQIVTTLTLCAAADAQAVTNIYVISDGNNNTQTVNIRDDGSYVLFVGGTMIEHPNMKWIDDGTDITLTDQSGNPNTVLAGASGSSDDDTGDAEDPSGTPFGTWTDA